MNTNTKIYPIYTDEICDEELEDAREWLSDECGIENPSEEEVWEEALESKSRLLDDEKGNLDVATQNRLIAVGTLGLWNGPAICFSVLTANVNSIFNAIHRLRCESSATIYADESDVQADEAHHDGVNHYLFREPIGDDEEVDELLDELRDAVYDRDGEKFHALIQTRTKSIRPYVAKVYGW
jgi:hypothetical protein